MEIQECIVLREVAHEDYDILVKATNYLATRRWGFVPYPEIEEEDWGLSAFCCMDEESDIDQIEDYLDSLNFHYYLEYV